MHPLDGVRAKLTRGEQHVNALNREVERLFTKRKHPPGFHIRHEFRPEDETFRIVVTSVDRLPAKLGTLVGDAVHNLRSALDQLVFELAFIDNGGSEDGLDKVAFPASLTADNFTGYWVQERMLAKLSKTNRAIIKRFQPCSIRKVDLRPKHFLAILDSLSNDDKHRLIQPLLQCPAQIGFVIPGNNQGYNCHFPGPTVRFVSHNLVGRPLNPDTELFRAPVVITGPNPDMPVEVKASTLIGFRDGTPIQIFLKQAIPFVQRIVDTFAPRFETRRALQMRDKPRYGRIPPNEAPVGVTFTLTGSDGEPIPFSMAEIK
jgi:hypothetical protein